MDKNEPETMMEVSNGGTDCESDNSESPGSEPQVDLSDPSGEATPTEDDEQETAADPSASDLTDESNDNGSPGSESPEEASDLSDEVDLTVDDESGAAPDISTSTESEEIDSLLEQPLKPEKDAFTLYSGMVEPLENPAEEYQVLDGADSYIVPNQYIVKSKIKQKK